MKKQFSNGAELQSNIEAVLFLNGEPMKISRLAKIFGVGEREVEEALDLLRDNLSGRAAPALQENRCGRGIRLVEKDGAVALATSPESAPFTRGLIEEEFDSSLTRAALETVSIVVYRGPVSRADIDYIRGVNSSFILRNLLVRGLVERIPNPRDSRSYLYRPTFALLRHLGVQSPEELPEFGSFNEKIDDFAESSDNEKGAGEAPAEPERGEQAAEASFAAENKNENEEHQDNIDIGAGGV